MQRLKTSLAFILLMGGGIYANDRVTLDLINIHSNDNTLDNIKIQNKNTTSTRDILREIPSVFMGGTNNLNQKIFMRGMSDRAVNISIDGARESGNNWHHAADLVIDLDILKAINIDTSILSVANNSGALAGAVKFNTLSAIDLLEDKQNLGAKIKTSFASNNKEWQKSIMTYGKLDNGFHLLAYVNHKNHSFSKDALKHESGGKGNNLSYFTKGGFLKDEHNLNISYESVYYKGDYPLVPEWAGSVAYDYYDKGNLVLAGTRGFDLIKQKMQRNTAVIDYNYDLNELINLNFKTYYTNRTLTLDDWIQTNASKEKVLEYLKGGVKTFGIYLNNKSKIEFDTFTHELFYGFEYFNTRSFVKDNYYKYNLSLNSSINEVFKAADDDIAQNYSIFLEDKISFYDLALITGLRFDNYKLNTIANQNQSRIKHNFKSFTPAIKLEYNVLPELQIYAGYTKLFKGAEPLEMIILRENRANKLRTNEDLKAQKGYGYELGIDYKKDFNELYVRANAKYYDRYYDSLIREETKRIGESGSFYTRLNGGKYNVYGVDLLAELAYKDFKSRLSYSRVRTNENNDTLVRQGYALAYSDPGDKYTLNIEYLYNNLLIGYDLIYFTSKSIKDSNYIKPSYAKHDLYMQYEVFKNFDIGFSINNIFNKLYYSHYKRSYGGAKSADWEAGRDYKISFNYKF
ncbi:TonB-dependent receptor [Campylobacter sp. 2018MI13]|uniref:TonB-dependent receptor n=1 Tax=Campylobacter sp. 2018MI13 TaxID=2836737 RepID=UPI001BDB36F8|nr:TonB-dependent receptor [Campylobacter sp. 2018MI13]MBT0882413.1 TonB-dependent receptor [Campylobacter sp. 2018MI13]